MGLRQYTNNCKEDNMSKIINILEKLSNQKYEDTTELLNASLKKFKDPDEPTDYIVKMKRHDLSEIISQAYMIGLNHSK